MDTDEYSNFLNEFMNESDRASVILGAAQIDELLTDIFKARLIEPSADLFKFNGPLGTFSAKIHMAHAVGVIDKSFANKIHLMRGIRNECAHNIERVDLDNGPMSQRVDELAKSFSDTEFWSTNLQEAGQIYSKKGRALILRFAIALLVANLATIKDRIKSIDGGAAFGIFSPTGKK